MFGGGGGHGEKLGSAEGKHRMDGTGEEREHIGRVGEGRERVKEEAL